MLHIGFNLFQLIFRKYFSNISCNIYQKAHILILKLVDTANVIEISYVDVNNSS